MKDNEEQTCSYELRKQGEDHLYKKQYSEAIAKFTEELEVLKKSEKPNLLRIAECHKHFGEAYKGKEDYENSIASFEKSLKKYEELCSKVIQNYHESIARISNQLGDVYIKVKNYDKAKKAYNNSIEHWGKTHEYLTDEYKLPKVAKNYNNLANIFALQQDFKSAEDNYLKALECFHKAYGEDAKDMKIAMCYMNLWEVTRASEKNEKHDEYFDRATNMFNALTYSDTTTETQCYRTSGFNSRLPKGQSQKIKIKNMKMQECQQFMSVQAPEENIAASGGWEVAAGATGAVGAMIKPASVVQQGGAALNQTQPTEETAYPSIYNNEKELIKELASLSLDDRSSDETSLSGQEPNTEGI